MVSQSALSAAVAVSCTQARGTPNSSNSNGLRLIQLPVLLGTEEVLSPAVSPNPRTVMATQFAVCAARMVESRSRSGIILNSRSSEADAGDADAVNCR